MSEVQLRDYQKNAIEQIEGAITLGDEEICLSAPTSFGKTITIAQFIKDQVDLGKHVVFMMNLTCPARGNPCSRPSASRRGRGRRNPPPRARSSRCP